MRLLQAEAEWLLHLLRISKYQSTTRFLADTENNRITTGRLGVSPVSNIHTGCVRTKTNPSTKKTTFEGHGLRDV